jgi:hypothetical protein
VPLLGTWVVPLDLVIYFYLNKMTHSSCVVQEKSACNISLQNDTKNLFMKCSDQHKNIIKSSNSFFVHLPRYPEVITGTKITRVHILVRCLNT